MVIASGQHEASLWLLWKEGQAIEKTIVTNRSSPNQMPREGTFRQVWHKCDNMGHFQNYIHCLHFRVPGGTLSLAVLPGPQGCVFAHRCLEKEISECSLLTSHTLVSLQASACPPQLIPMLLSFGNPGRSKEQRDLILRPPPLPEAIVSREVAVFMILSG